MLLMSGIGDHQLEELGYKKSEFELLRKPVRMEHLTEKVRALMERT